MASPAIPTFDQFKAQAAIPTFDQFKAGIPPNPSDSIPAAKQPIPAGLQGPPPSRMEQLVQNIPQSAVNAITHPTFPGLPVDAPPMDPNDNRSMAEKWAQEELPKISHAIHHPIDTIRDAFVDDPVGSTLTAAQLGKGAVEYGPAAVEAAQNGARTVAAVTKGAMQGAKEGALSTTPVPGHSYVARGLRAVGIDKVPAVGAGALIGKYAAHALFGPEAATAGEVVGAATPIVRGAWLGGKQALEDLRTPPSAEALPVSRQLPPAPRGIPAPEDTSGVIKGWKPTVIQPDPLPESRQLNAGPNIIIPPAPQDASGVIKGWRPQILENENQPAAVQASAQAAPQSSPAPAETLPSPTTLARLKMTPEDFAALPKDGQADILAIDRSIQAPVGKRPAPPATPVDLAAPPSVEKPPAAPIKTQEQLMQEVIAQKRAERLAREAAPAPAQPAPQLQPQQNGPVADPAIGKDFGDHARLQPRSDLPALPGHTPLNSDMGQSISYDPATKEMQILFKRDGTLYRYPNVPQEAHDALMNAPSMGAHFQRSFRPKYPGIKMQMPGQNTPLLPGVAEPGVPPPADAVPLQPPPVGGNIPPDARLQGQGLPGSAVNGGGAPSQGPPNPQANGALQPAGSNATSVLIPGSTDTYPARYELRELADINASHSGNTFQPNEKYGLANERDYTKRDNQGKVVANSGPLFDPRFHVTDNPDATNGPIIVNENGDASAGNGRKMMLDRVYSTNPRGAQAYRDLLAKKAPQFGIDPGQVAQMKQPVLVRVVSNADGARAMADLNKVGTAALTPSERAVADSRRVSPGTLNDISARMDAVGPDASLKDVLNGRSGAEVLNRLIDDGVISPQERAALAQGDDLTPAGKDRISKLMLGRFFRDPAQMDTISPAIKGKLERIAGPVAAAEESPGWGLGEHIKNALDLSESAKAAGRRNLDEFVKQSGLYSSQQFPPEVVDLAKSLQKTTQGQALQAAHDYLEKARYARDYQGPGMFQQFPEPSNPQTALAEFLQDIKKPKVPHGAGVSQSHAPQPNPPAADAVDADIAHALIRGGPQLLDRMMNAGEISAQEHAVLADALGIVGGAKAAGIEDLDEFVRRSPSTFSPESILFAKSLRSKLPLNAAGNLQPGTPVSPEVPPNPYR